MPRRTALPSKQSRPTMEHGMVTQSRESVPAEIVDRWLDSQKVTRRQIAKHWRKEKDDLGWAIGEDIE